MYDLIGNILMACCILLISLIAAHMCIRERRVKWRAILSAIAGLAFICYCIHDIMIIQEVKRYDFLWSADSIVLHSDSKEEEYDCTKIFADIHGVLLAPGHDHVSTSDHFQKIGTLTFRSNIKQVVINVVRFVDPPDDLTRVNRVGEIYYAFLGDEFFTRTFQYDIPSSIASEIIKFI